MKARRTYIVLALTFLMLVVLAYLTPKKISWTPTYGAAHKMPYGAYILFGQLRDIFPGSEIDQPDRGFYTFEENNFDTSSNYIIITDELQADDLDVRRMAAFATAGNNIFISAYALPQKLQDTLGIQLQNSLDLLPSDSAGYMTNFADPKIRTKEGYRFRHESLSFQIENADRHKVNHLVDDSSESGSIVMRDRIVLGKDAKENANFVKIPFGKGAFFIHTFPLAFTNY
ncbi:MAG: hypothetical protein JWO03_1310, partial [Bacteroidetes bacterium]|nr:hypothetical protein [Bacteroidota bacterium]